MATHSPQIEDVLRILRAAMPRDMRDPLAAGVWDHRIIAVLANEPAVEAVKSSLRAINLRYDRATSEALKTLSKADEKRTVELKSLIAAIEPKPFDATPITDRILAAVQPETK